MPLQTDDKTPAVATDELWSMAIDRARLQTQWDACQAAIRKAMGRMRLGFDACPLTQAGAREMHFAEAWQTLRSVVGE